MKPLPKSSRKFTKRLVIVCFTLTWTLMFMSIYFGQAQHVVASGFALLATLFGVYTGVGHLDLRKMVDLATVEIEADVEETNQQNNEGNEG